MLIKQLALAWLLILGATATAFPQTFDEYNLRRRQQQRDFEYQLKQQQEESRRQQEEIDQLRRQQEQQRQEIERRRDTRSLGGSLYRERY